MLHPRGVPDHGVKEHVVFPRRVTMKASKVIYDDEGLLALLKDAGRSSEECR